MENNFIVKFDYNIDVLNELVREVKLIDKTNLELVKEAHKKLAKVRTTIKNQEKVMVDEANKFRNTVFTKRDEYLNLTEPLEKEMKSILDNEEKRIILEARKTLLPSKKHQLSQLNIIQPTDDEILVLDDSGWSLFYNTKFQEHTRNEKEIVDRKEREDKIRKEVEERVEKEKKEALTRAEKDKIEAIAKIERDTKNKIENEKREKEALEQKELEAKKKLESESVYKKFLKENNYSESTDKIFRDGDEVKIYRLVATLKLNK